MARGQVSYWFFNCLDFTCTFCLSPFSNYITTITVFSERYLSEGGLQWGLENSITGQWGAQDFRKGSWQEAKETRSGFFRFRPGELLKQLNCSNYSNGCRLRTSGPFYGSPEARRGNFQNALCPKVESSGAVKIP